MGAENVDQIPKWLSEVRTFLDERFSDRLSLSEIAAFAGVHPVYLGRAFRAHYGCSIGEYLTECRLELARDLLENSEMSLSQIAITSGFYDQGHFSNKFKKHHGISPSEFRNSLRES
jgi:AraC family transcriptional regulator